MNIQSAETYQVRLLLKTPFVTSYGRLEEKALDLFVITDEQGNQGLGELIAFEQPDYVQETLVTERFIIQQHLIPLLLTEAIEQPQEVSTTFEEVKGHWMGKAALETAIWNLYAKRQQRSLTEFFGPTRKKIPAGTSLGIQEDLPQLLKQVQLTVEKRYQQVKLKIRPGYDVESVVLIRQHFPNLPLMVDANPAYALADLPQLQHLDHYQLATIEQPFVANDSLDHAQLQRESKTGICLDENARSLKDCQVALALGSYRSISLKIPHVGGIHEALKIAAFRQENDLLVWLGGVFESGVGRVLNLQSVSQPTFSFPGDILATERYLHEDVITEPFILEQGTMTVPQGFGIGVTLSQTNLLKYSQYQKIM